MAEAQGERRKQSRMNLSLLVRVQGYDATGARWEEVSMTHDANTGGLSIPLKHAVQLGQVVLLSLPLPKRFRRFDQTQTTYRVYGLVRGLTSSDSTWRVGIVCLGKHPPRDFD